jgi:hypothetical protein
MLCGVSIRIDVATLQPCSSVSLEATTGQSSPFCLNLTAAVHRTLVWHCPLTTNTTSLCGQAQAPCNTGTHTPLKYWPHHAKLEGKCPKLTCLSTHARALTHPYTCARAHTHTHTYTYIHTHTHTHTCLKWDSNPRSQFWTDPSPYAL